MKTIKVGIAGLGRLGKVHANNIAFKIPNATLTAACSIVPAELEYAKNELGVTDLYTDYREMLEKADIDAVAIVTTSSEHCWQIEAALDAGKHVFTDKPLGVDLEQCKLAEAAMILPMHTQRRRFRKAPSASRTWSRQSALIRKLS